MEQRVLREQRHRQESIALGSSPWSTVTAEAIARFFEGIAVVDVGIPLIRIGAEFDGGYLVPDDLAGINRCFSPGVADMIAFDLELASRGIQVHAIDGSVSALPHEHPLIDFEPLFLGAESNPGWTNLTDWVDRRSVVAEDLMLELDIEGHEWALLLDTPDEVLGRFRIMVVEFHGLHNVAFAPGLAAIQTVFKKVLRQFNLVHLHANNNIYPVEVHGRQIPSVVEATFLRRDRGRSPRARARLAHELDRPNQPDLFDHPLDPAWL